MYQLAKLVLINYQPKELEEDMMFAMDVHLRTFDGDYSYLHVHTLDKVPKDKDKYIRENGFPVHMYLIAQEQTNPDVAERIIAAPDQIGLWDDGDDEETLRFIDVSDINSILMNEGYVMVFADEDGDPILEEGYVTLCAHIDDEDEEWIQTWGEDDNNLEPWQEQSDQQ
jgi:hypothetical protein